MKNNTQSIISPAIPIGQEADMQQNPCAYLLVNYQNGAIYTGATTSLLQQVWKHKHHMIEGFSRKYDIHSLVWHEQHDTMESAYERVMFLKNSAFEVKQEIVEQVNPKWRDLYDDLCLDQLSPQKESA